MMCTMPINSALVNLFGTRQVCSIGGLLYASGLFLTSISPNIYFFYIVHGLMLGWCDGIVLLSWMALVSFYFERKRSVASAICLCGSSIGTTVWAPLGNYLLSSLGLMVTLCIFGGITLLICAFSLLLKPLALEIIIPEESIKSDTLENNQFARTESFSNSNENYLHQAKYRKGSIVSISPALKSKEVTMNPIKTVFSYVNESFDENSEDMYTSACSLENSDGKKHSNEATFNETSIKNSFNIAFVETSHKNSKRRHSVGVISTTHETPKIRLEPKEDFPKRRQSVLEIRPFTRMDTMYEGSLTKLASKMNQNQNKSDSYEGKITENQIYKHYRNSIVSIDQDFVDRLNGSGDMDRQHEVNTSIMMPRGSVLAEHIKLNNRPNLDYDTNNGVLFNDSLFSFVKNIQKEWIFYF